MNTNTNNKLIEELIKELPIERQEWNYDDDGYADKSDHDSPSEALRNIHTGALEDYLAENNLTELYGWATDDAVSDPRRPEILIWLDNSGGSDADEIGSFEVREVELYNVKEGMEEERRTICLLDDGDGEFSAVSSYEEAERIINENLGEVITEEEAEYRMIYSEDKEGVMRDEDGRDEEGYDHAGYTVVKGVLIKGEAEPRDRLGFNKEGFIAYPHSRIEVPPRREDIYDRYAPVSINAAGRDEDGFKVGSFDEEAAKEEVMEEGSVSSPMDHFVLLSWNDEFEGEGEENPSYLEDRHTEDANLPYHHKDTGTLFNPEGKDYWGRTTQEADELAAGMEEDGLIPNE